MSFWQLWNMSFGFLGIQFGFELQNSNVSRIFETLGANKDEIPILWIAAPLTGLLVQPIIGYLSDRTWHPNWGRRRPFFFIGALLATFALIMMPNSSALWIAGGMLWILDASINITMEPFRAFVGDKLNPEQRTAGFAMQSFFIGIGSVIAALLPWIFANWFNVSNQAAPGVIPDSVKWSFYVGAFAFLTAVLYTVFTTDEFPPENIQAFKDAHKNEGIMDGLKNSFLGIFKMPPTMKQLAIVQFFTWFSLFSMWIYSTNAVTSNIYDMSVSKGLFDQIETRLSGDLGKNSNPQLKALQADIDEIKHTQAKADNRIITINLANYAHDAKIFSGDDLTQVDRVRQQYNDGADWLGVCSSIRNGVAAIFAFLIPVIARRSSRKITHMICLIIGGIGLLMLNFINQPWMIGACMALVGVAWASILSMPYAILSGALPTHKMGYYMGVFNFFIVIPQIVAATILGFFTDKVFNGNTMLTLALGGMCMILAGFLTLRVKDEA